MSPPSAPSKNKPNKKPAWKQVAMFAIDFQWTTRHYIPEDRSHNHHCENLKSWKFWVLLSLVKLLLITVATLSKASVFYCLDTGMWFQISFRALKYVCDFPVLMFSCEGSTLWLGDPPSNDCYQMSINKIPKLGKHVGLDHTYLSCWGRKRQIGYKLLVPMTHLCDTEK
jgi:hypothetical protein